jgi:hypothetical protein
MTHTGQKLALQAVGAFHFPVLGGKLLVDSGQFRRTPLQTSIQSLDLLFGRSSRADVPQYAKHMAGFHAFERT